jgi:hypothetical protein
MYEGLSVAEYNETGLKADEEHWIAAACIIILQRVQREDPQKNSQQHTLS